MHYFTQRSTIFKCVGLLTLCASLLFATAPTVRANGPSSDFIQTPEVEVFVMAGTSPAAVSRPVTAAGLTGAPNATATITIEYNAQDCLGTLDTWPVAAQAALARAAEIWETLVNSNVEIVIAACWRTDLDADVLGSASTRFFQAIVNNSPTAGNFYPDALANAIGGFDILPDRPDMRANFNSTKNWHFDPDTAPAADEFDLTTVALREIAHGLGFLGTGYVQDSLGYWGFEAIRTPLIFDRFTEDGTGTPITDRNNGTDVLRQALEGELGGLFFNGPHTVAANGGIPAALNAPSPWDPNASQDFLAASFDGTANDLMTHTLNTGEAFRQPGPVTLGILADIGWPQDVRNHMTDALGNFSYDPTPVPNGQLGTLIINLGFTYNNPLPLSAVKFLVTTASNARLADAYPENEKTFFDTGGVNTLQNVPNSLLPGGTETFTQTETLTVPFNVLINEAPWAINFEMYASSDPLNRSRGGESLLRFSLDSSMFDIRYIRSRLYLPLVGQ